MYNNSKHNLNNAELTVKHGDGPPQQRAAIARGRYS